MIHAARPIHFKALALGALTLVLTCAGSTTAQEEPANPSPAVISRVWPDSPVLADNVAPTPAAHELRGWEVLAPDGASLGTLRDFVIDMRSGEIAYAIVRSGGFLGVGARHHPVPLSALDRLVPEDRALVSRISEEGWDRAPVLEDRADITPLTLEDRRREIHEHYRRAGATASDDAWGTGAGGDAQPQLRLASRLRGLEVRNNRLELGTVDVVLVNLNEGEAMLRLALDATTTGTSDEFLVGFGHVASAASDRDQLVTPFSVDDFQRALPQFVGDLEPPEPRSTGATE